MIPQNPSQLMIGPALRIVHRSGLVCGALLLLLLASCGGDEGEPAILGEERPASTQVIPESSPPAPDAEHLAAAAENGIQLIGESPAGEWRLPAGDYANTRYSPLDQINSTNVQNLKYATEAHTGIPHGHEGNPLVVNNTMYMVTPFPNYLIAIDLTVPGGAIKWRYEPHPDPTAFGKACCDIVNRGASYADGLIVYNLLDATTVAVDAETGEEVWRTEMGDVNKGETMTMAALAAEDMVIVGNSGGELGVHGFIAALDLHSGEEIWRAYSTGPDEIVRIGEEFDPYYAKDHGEDLGAKTWPPDQWRLGGGTVWGWISYDPELRTIYYGTGNPGVWNPDMRPGANKWSCTIFARDIDTGMAKWAYQIVPHDAWDYDEIMENILVDAPINGEMRKLLIHPGRTGFVFVMDRVTGELLSAEEFQYVNWAEGYDLDTGQPIINEEKRTHEGQLTRDICPSSTGAKEFVPSALSPRTGLMYIPSMHLCMDYLGMEANYIAGTPYLGASVIMKPGPYGPRGELVAWDPINARRVWSIPEHFPVYSGVLATGGDVVFYGTFDGWFKAVDARTGADLWKTKLGSGIVSNPMTYLGPDGKQFVAVYAGIGGWMGATAFPALSVTDPEAALGVVGAVSDIKRHTAPGGSVYVFAL